MEPTDEKPINLKEYLNVLVHRRWIIIAIFFLVTILSSVHTFSQIPIYRATARIVIEKENPNLISIEEVMSVNSAGSDYYQTQYKIIESRSVARDVIRRLKLEDSEEFFPPPRTDILSRLKKGVHGCIQVAGDFYSQKIGSLLRTGQAADMPSERSYGEPTQTEGGINPRLESQFISRISVEPIRGSRLVDVGIHSRNPRMAARMANELVRAYIDQNLETKLQAAKDAVSWLTKRIEEERKKVEAAENALLEYKKENDIITDFSSDSENITAGKLARLNEQAIEAESRRVEAETRYQQALSLKDNPDMLDSIPEVLSNELVQEIKKMEMDLYNRMSELSKKYGQNHPRMIAIQSELEELAVRKEREAERIVNSLHNEYQLALARERSLKAALNSQKQESLELNKKAIQYNVLKRQAESSKQMYDLLVKRFKETSLTEEMKTGNIRIIDEAQTPLFPFKPNKKRAILLGAALGLMFGVGLAFLLEYLDNTVKMPDELQDTLGIPFLGLVPAFKVREDVNGYAGDLISLRANSSNPAEAFRHIRTALLFSSPERIPQVILVSSAGAGEGKSLCAANLAVTMAKAESRTILIECDMRRPRFPHLFRTEQGSGLSSIIVGSVPHPEDEIISTDLKNLDILPCGPKPPNPADLLGSNSMANLIENLQKRYDRILLDCPPLLSVTDAAILSQKSDGVVLIIQAGVTPRQMVENAVNKLRQVGAHILGAVLNGVDLQRNSYYYSSYYYGDHRLTKTDKHRNKMGDGS